MGKHIIKYTNAKTGKVEEEVRYDLEDEFEVGPPLKVDNILRRDELKQKGFSNLTDEEKEEWKNLFK